jgi:hypothetical protein
MSNWQDALSSVRCDCIQASILPPPGFTPAQIFLTSPRHAFPIAAALTKMVWHVGVRSFKCELMQALMRPAPGCTPPHCALTSAAHSFGTAAIVLVVESKRMAPIAHIFFSISLCPRFLPSQIELGATGYSVVHCMPIAFPPRTQILRLKAKRCVGRQPISAFSISPCNQIAVHACHNQS